MKFQKSPNRWSCLPTAFAIAMNLPVERLIREIGHDGSEILWPELPEPFCRRSFHLQEIIDVGYRNDYAIIPIEAEPVSRVYSSEQLYKPELPPGRMNNYLKKEKGVILGSWGNKPHAAAWNISEVYDPSGKIYSTLNTEIKIWMFCIVKGINFQNQIKK